MKTLVIYYSYTGKTRKLAKETAEKENADIVEVKDQKRRSTIGAYVAGSFAAMKQKESKIEKMECDFGQYDKIIILMPIWAGYPAPSMNNIINKLPEGKDVELIMTSGSGNSGKSADKTKALITGRGCKVIKYSDVRGY